MALIFMLEDDFSLGSALKLYLESKGYTVSWSRDIREATLALNTIKPDLLLFDWSLPDGTGFDLYKRMSLHKEKPLYFLTAREDEESAMSALSQGAVDYLRKPFGKNELLIKIKKSLKEAVSPIQELRCGDLILNLNTRVALYKGTEIELRRKEFDVLEVLVKKADQIVSRNEVLSNIDDDGSVFDRTIDSYVSRLRKALQKNTIGEIELVSVYGEGYRIKKKAA